MDVQQTQHLYGEQPTADIAYVNTINANKSAYVEDYTSDSFVEYLDQQLSPPTEICEIEYDDEEENKSFNEFAKERIEEQKKYGLIPPVGGPVDFELPKIKLGSKEMEEAGYYRYRDRDKKVFGTARTIWRIQAAGRVLAKKGITMGIGDISKKGGKTKGHTEHQEGQDVDLRLISKSGRAEKCSVKRKWCYDREKTFEMVKALIDTDPTKVDKVLINDSKLRRKINRYYQKKTGSKRKISRSCRGHDDHIHMSWKKK